MQEGFRPDTRVLPEAPQLTPDLAAHLGYLEAALAEAHAAPLSQRKALLVVMLVDAHVERLFAATRHGADDVLAFREGLEARYSVLAVIHDIALQRPDGPRLVTEAVAVPLADYPGLDVADFMVSLYNDHTVPRVMIAMADGSRRPAHEVLVEAVAALTAASQGTAR